MKTTAAIHSLCAKCGEAMDGGSMLLTSDRKLYHIHCSPYVDSTPSTPPDALPASASQNEGDRK